MISVRWHSAADVDERLCQAWTQLGLHAAQPDFYAMPQFVLPASRWLTPRNPARIAVVERRSGGSPELLGIGCFTHHGPTLFAPFPHLRCYRTRHTFQDGMLCASGAEDEVAQALLDAATGAMRGAGAIALRNIPAEDPLFNALCARASAAGHGWYQLRALARPVLHRGPDGRFASRIPRRVVRDIARKRRRLETMGKLSFRLFQDGHATDDVVTRHLDIEHLGWKGQAGSSMRSSAAETAFFHDMCDRLRGTGGAVFCETLLDGRVIASASTFRAGGILNAFKTGHDPEFASNSPGKANVLSLIEAMPEMLPDVRMFDSNSREDSFIGAMLPDRRNMLAGFLPLGRLARRALEAARWIRPLAYRLDKDP
ncbi:GNAT family N-acetyltransferase [Luteimonas notoginsengisoli]|uniref:GNAT family N-acetyltransferase n=1 Tax=Luteimonas notoginsengisoli TaxID=1578200 RepID=A0ABV7UVV1_9GAMM